MVAVPVQRVVLSDDDFVTDHSSSPVSIHLIDGRPSTLRCAAFGGYPPPSVELYVARRKVTGHFQFLSNASLSGRRGLREITYRTERSTHNYLPNASDDQARLKCVATVVQLKDYVETVLLSIDCKLPTPHCNSLLRSRAFSFECVLLQAHRVHNGYSDINTVSVCLCLSARNEY